MVRIAALVLAGGRSSRFGAEKATALLDARPLLAHVADALRPGCLALAVNARPGSAAAAWARGEELRVLPDPPGLPDGPLTGVLEGLRWASRLGCEALATAPCDTPWLPLELAKTLAAAMDGAPAAFAQTAGGSHPLCTMWRTELAAPLAEALAVGHPSVRAWLEEMGARAVRFEDTAAFANVNTPADLPAQADNAPRVAP